MRSSLSPHTPDSFVGIDGGGPPRVGPVCAVAGVFGFSIRAILWTGGALVLVTLQPSRARDTAAKRAAGIRGT